MGLLLAHIHWGPPLQKFTLAHCLPCKEPRTWGGTANPFADPWSPQLHKAKWHNLSEHLMSDCVHTTRFAELQSVRPPGSTHDANR